MEQKQSGHDKCMEAKLVFRRVCVGSLPDTTTADTVHQLSRLVEICLVTGQDHLCGCTADLQKAFNSIPKWLSETIFEALRIDEAAKKILRCWLRYSR